MAPTANKKDDLRLRLFWNKLPACRSLSPETKRNDPFDRICLVIGEHHDQDRVNRQAWHT